MPDLSLKHILFGFLAGVIATVTIHELIKLALFNAGIFPRSPWSMNPAAMTGLPQIASDAFWGGLWGALFAVVFDYVPGAGATSKGLVFGILGPALLGVFLLVPLITGRFPVFFGGDPKMIGSVLLILAGFGAATGWLYSLFVGTSASAPI